MRRQQAGCPLNSSCHGSDARSDDDEEDADGGGDAGAAAHQALEVLVDADLRNERRVLERPHVELPASIPCKPLDALYAG